MTSNLVVANRMIILAPMWNLDTQAQAIKVRLLVISINSDLQRIHRIGQTRATKVEILVTQDTFEEEIARRASTTRTENEEKAYTRNLIEVSLYHFNTGSKLMK
jgi:SNF2 family DNA or RNA helicase